MIELLIHSNPANNRAFNQANEIVLKGNSTFTQLRYLAQLHPQEWIGWKDYKHKATSWDDLKKKAINPYVIVSKGVAPAFLAQGMEYIEDTPFINFKENQWYPTWIMSGAMGMIHSSLLQLTPHCKPTENWEYELNLFSKQVQSQGVFCYSKLTKNHTKTSARLLYLFAAQTMKKGWLLFLLLCHLWYEKRFPVYAFAKAQFYKKRQLLIDLSTLQKTTAIDNQVSLDYDVIIPTMGRAKYLKDVLKDLSNQTVLPHKVIIIEQNPDETATTQLYFIEEKKWPFEIIHQLIHQTGACNARNLALKQTTAPWVLFFDDDVRIPFDFFLQVQIFVIETKSIAITFACLQKGEKETMQAFKQWEAFGSGCSMVHRDVIEQCDFDMALEHGYGEDVDYGMQIRNAGYDIIYAPQIQILHLKAPVGGFREPHVFPWKQEKIQPKPSPQIMYFRKKNYSHQQLLGYKMVQFFKTFGAFDTKNPWKHYGKYLQAWKQSEKWAYKL